MIENQVPRTDERLDLVREIKAQLRKIEGPSARLVMVDGEKVATFDQVGGSKELEDVEQELSRVEQQLLAESRRPRWLALLILNRRLAILVAFVIVTVLLNATTLLHFLR
jgi:hypothetical protein